MAQAQQGDKRAYTALLTEITPFVRNIIAKRLSHKDGVEDVVQDVLLGLHHARHTYDPARPFHTWLFAIVRYKALDALRAQYRKGGQEIVDSDFVVTLADTVANTSEESTALRQDVATMLAALKPKQRKLVVLTKVYGHSVAQVAAQEGMSVSAVKVSVHRALNELKTKFGQKE